MKNASSHPDASTPTRQAARARAILGGSAQLAEYFAMDCAWLKQREEIWASQSFRVGLIGITSSGKSTLVNALLDDRVLPVQVRPSSNCLVLCRWGASKKGVVHFLDGRRVEFRDDAIATQFARFADEGNNPDNVHGVAEIELYWPQFRLGREVVLVDSPGLDAFSRQRHEDVTLEQLLPTVDVVVFLTTAKANADASIKHYLDLIGSHGKPTIVVQNMLDSIEPKLGLFGRVVRSRTQVAREHLKRMQRLLHHADSSQISESPIYQVSALDAIQGRLIESGIPDLVTALEHQFGRLEPTLHHGRRRQLWVHLNRIIAREQRGETGGSANTDAELTELKSHKQTLKRISSKRASSFGAIRESAGARSRKLRAQLDALTPRDVSHARAAVKDLKEWLDYNPEALREEMAKYRKQITALGEALNLRSEDLRVPPLHRRLNHDIPNATTTHRTTAYEDVPGLLAKLARWFGLGGTREVTETKTVVDVDTLLHAFKTIIREELAWLDDVLEQVDGHGEAVEQRLRDEVDRQQRDMQQKLALHFAGAERSRAIGSLQELCSQLNVSDAAAPEATSHSARPLYRASQRTQVQVAPELAAIAQLSQLIVARRLLRQRDARLRETSSRPPARVLVCGHDVEAAQGFLRRFWFDCVAGSLSAEGGFEAIPLGAQRQFAVAVELSSLKNSSQLAETAERFIGAQTVLFALLDAEQTGATQSQLQRSVLSRVYSGPSPCILVVQRIKGLENAGELAAGLRELRRVVKDQGLNVVGVLANDDRWWASELVHALYTRGGELKTLADENRWAAVLASRGKPPAALITQTLRHWREHRTHGQEMS